MKRYLIILVVASVGIFLSCSDDNLDMVAYQPQIVVEGSIENDGYASVLLSWSVSFTGAMDTTSLLNHAIRNAKVTVSDGTNEEVLLLRTNSQKIPPYEYITTQMKGQVGKAYYLTVEYYDNIITSQTSIPTPVEIDSLWFKKENKDQKYGYVHIRFRNESEQYYQLSTKVEGVEKRFTPCLYGNLDHVLYPQDEMVLMQINKGPIIFPEPDYETSFSDTATILVRLSTQDRPSYDFWTSYQNEILNSQNPIFPSTSKLKSNIKGGIGIWSGFGSSIKRLKANQIKKERY